MRQLRNSVLFTVLIFLAPWLVAPTMAGAACPAGATCKTYPIILPNVTSREDPHKEIEYAPGDRVVIEAGGCVNDWGISGGKTSKRYVLPEGGGSDRLYSGLFWLPGAYPGPGGLTRFADFHTEVHISDAADRFSELFLHLGYEDDYYPDNNYKDIDIGNPVQCGAGQYNRTKVALMSVVAAFLNHKPLVAVEPDPSPYHPERQKYRRESAAADTAYVEVTVIHPDVDNADPPRDADLVFNKMDGNGMPLDAEWGKQLRGAGALAPVDCNYFKLTNDALDMGNPSCSSTRPSTDVAHLPNSVTCKTVTHGDTTPGHVNFGPVAQTGQIYFDDHATDDDFDLHLWRKNMGLVTTANDWPDSDPTSKGLDLEFKAGEVQRFASAWWQTLYTLGVRDDPNTGSALSRRQ